jgi:hypothetical protein
MHAVLIPNFAEMCWETNSFSQTKNDYGYQSAAESALPTTSKLKSHINRLEGTYKEARGNI